MRFHVFSSPLYFLPARESADTDQNARSDSESERTLTLVLTITENQWCETSGNTESSNWAYLGGFCSCQKRLETYRPTLKTMVSPVRVRVPPLLFYRYSQVKRRETEKA